MARWQRRARLGFGTFAVVFAGVLWFMTGERQAPAPPQAVERMDPEAVSEIRGGDVVQVKGARRDIRVEFATQVLYSDGGMRYTGFKAFVDDRGGRSFEITGNEAHVAPNQSAFDVRGDVTVSTSDGLVAKTGQATFAEADGILRGDGPLTFTRGRVSGAGVGFAYDRSLDRLELRQDAVIDVAPAAGAEQMAVRAGTAAYSRAERFMRFERGARLERQGQVMEAATATVFMLPDRDEPELIELRGQSRISGAAGIGSLKAMQASDINLRYGADGRTLEHALLVGNADVRLAAPGAASEQQLAAQSLDVALAPDGAVTGLAARDQVRVVLPSVAGAAARAVTSQTLQGEGAPGRGLTRMIFEGDVRYREETGGGKTARTARSRLLNASLTDAGGIDEALFSGGVTFEDGAMVATSVNAAYQVSKGLLALRAPGDEAQPQMKDPRLDLRATSIDVTLNPRRLNAIGKVSAIFAAGPGGASRPSLLTEDEAVVIICDTLVFDETTGAGTYSGGARLLQQKSGNSIRGDVVTMNEKTGVLSATGQVVTSLPLATTVEGPKGNSVGRANAFEFSETERRALFTGDPAQLDGAQGNLRANQIELTLAGGGNDLQQMIAEGGVSVTLDSRKATGQHLVYQPADGKYVLNGTPVRLVQGCEESTGRTLTFFRDSERISVDGNEEIRVQTKGGKCPGTPERP